ncbi:serine/threonine-protein kinase HT1-like [Hibiscus syriacus]|uniref:Serine/threonine-protein kinase HT1-like n=1 Tax=Hibiscus syriacus TaxID=106335 RepID=A0A6A2XC48_HIBSY|nr:non-classical arabinogalactan protein 31-like [Hibiscus syriacus]KAE8659706.1 serine/threonine-protein kinase HT1-like [Hibiscus syriacus]
MGLALVVRALLLLQLTQLLLSSFVVSDPILPQASPPSYHAVSPVKQPTPPPSHHHHHHHHPHPHPPSPAPTKPPTYPPKAPTPAPPKPPVHPTPKPPVHPPTKPPTTKPPTYPPPKPPSTKTPTYPAPKPPVHPPTKPPTTKPPTYPAPKPPIRPPTKPPTTKPPTYPAPKSPVHPPTKPPSPPVQPPSYPKPQISNVAVQGVVYCKSCKYAGVDTLLGAKPVLGATVRLACKDSKNNLTVQFTTDKNGYFFLRAPNTIYNFSLRNCSVSLISSPLKSCSTPSNLNGGLKGTPLKPENSSTSKKLPYVLYSVGPFAFEPKCH